MSPMFDTRHEFQPSTNFLAPISTLTVASGLVDPPEHGPAHGVLLHDDPGVGLQRQLLEPRSVADVGEAEVVVRHGRLQPQLAGRAPDVAEAQAARAVGVEEGLQQVGVDRPGDSAGLGQLVEAPGEEIDLPGRVQPRLAPQEPRDGVLGPTGLAQHPVEEELHVEHVAGVAPVAPVDRVDAASHEDPQRRLQVVGAQMRPRCRGGRTAVRGTRAGCRGEAGR